LGRRFVEIGSVKELDALVESLDVKYGIAGLGEVRVSVCRLSVFSSVPLTPCSRSPVRPVRTSNM